MRCSLVLVLVLVCFALSRADPSPSNLFSEAKFGDIFSMPLACTPGGIANHFAIYVGNETINGIERNATDYFFHHQGSGCVFGDLRQRRGIRKAEEYDFTLEETTKEKMIERIQEMRNNCGTYNVLKNNCEHLVTYIRFNERLTLQRGTAAHLTARLCKTGDIKNCDRYNQMIENAKKWEQCSETDINNNNSTELRNH